MKMCNNLNSSDSDISWSGIPFLLQVEDVLEVLHSYCSNTGGCLHNTLNTN